jgi:hypothetical protein
MLLDRRLKNIYAFLPARRMDPPATLVYRAVVEKPSSALLYVATIFLAVEEPLAPSMCER